MIYLLITIALSVSIISLFKLFKTLKVNNLQAITTNYIVAVFFSILMYGKDFSINTAINQSGIYFAMLTGLFFIVVFNVFAMSSQKTGVGITAVSSKMSVMIPVIAGIMFLPNEKMNVFIGIGIVLALISFWLIFKTKDGELIDKRYFILPILLFFGNGINDTLMKFSQVYFIKNSKDIHLFLAVVFATAFIIGILINVIVLIKNKVVIDKRSLAMGILLGILNFGSTFFFFKTLQVFNATVLFPIFNVGIVVSAALVGLIAFREKFSLINWFGILSAVASILFIALSS